MLNKNFNKDNFLRTILESKKIVEIVGCSLGNFIADIHEGEIKGEKWNENQKNLVRGTKYFILGGSIGTNGFTKELIPLWIKKRLQRRSIKDEDVIFLPVSENINSFKAGALGAFFAFTKEVMQNITKSINNIPTEKIPIIPLMDIGGTKIHFVLAHLNENGDLTYKILEQHTFPTPFFNNPDQFYKDIVSFIYPVLKRFEDSCYEIIKIMGIGQPGRFEDPQGEIIDGAGDLGNLIGSCPAKLVSESFMSYGIEDYSFHFCNDGNAQFFGLVSNIKIHNPLLWEKLSSNKERIMYLGIGTGLGIGYGSVEQNELMVNPNVRDAIGLLLPNEFRNYLFDNYEIMRSIYEKEDIIEYRQIVSSKLFHTYMHYLELDALTKSQEFYFLKETGIDIKNIPSLSFFLKSESIRYMNGNVPNNKKALSPLNAMLINDILKGEINTAKTEVIFSIKDDQIRKTLKDSLHIFSEEIKEKLIGNIINSTYEEIINEITYTKLRGNIVYFAGIGKSHSISKNLSYIYNNLGIRSSYIELTGANSENLTSLKRDDLVFLISNSGKAYELLNILPYIKGKGCKTIAITGESESYLRKGCDFFINSHSDKNPSIVKEAPTTSTTLALVAGTAVAIIVSFHFDYGERDFYLDHPTLEFDREVKFKEVKSDPSFNIIKRVQDIFNLFSKSIKEYAYESSDRFESQIIDLAKLILVSHFNNRTVFFTGSGASLKVAEKVAATLTSIGIDADIVNPALLPHGDFAHIKKNDLLIVFTYSGNTRHLMKICEIAKKGKGARVALITSSESSKLKENDELTIVNIKKIDESKLVPIPDQKITSSCINLVVGDILAIILANILNASKEVFAVNAHQGGEIGREEDMHNKILIEGKHGDLTDLLYPFFNNGAKCKFDDLFNKAECDDCGYKKQKDCSSQKEAIQLLKKHLKQVSLKGYEYSELLDLFKIEFNTFNNGFNNQTKTGEVLVIGAGSIGLTYIARILNKYKKTIHFVDKNIERISNLSSKKYSLTEGKESVTVKRFSITESNNITQIANYALRNNLVFVSIGIENHKDIIDTIKFIVLRRYAYNIHQPINFVFNENFVVEENPLAKLRYEILEAVESPDIKIYFSEKVGLVPAVDEVLAPIISDNFNFTKSLPVEPEIAPMYISKREWKFLKKENKKLKGQQVEENEISECKEIHFVDDFHAYHMRKLWIHNMAHFLIAVKAKEKGISTIGEAAEDKEIEESVRKSIDVIGEQIYRRWEFDDNNLKEYCQWLFDKYKNKGINDTVERVLRDPKRKLGKYDRLIGSLNYAYEYGESNSSSYEEIIKGICYAMKSAARDELDKQKNAGKIDLSQEKEELQKIYDEIRDNVKRTLKVDFEEVLKMEKQFQDS